MRISTDTWHYRVWEFTHRFRFLVVDDEEGYGPPERTSLCRYVSRTILMPIPTVLFYALGMTIFILGNALTILSGTGLFGIGDRQNEKGEVKMVSRFPPIRIGSRQVPMPRIVLASWGLLAIVILVLNYPTTLTYAKFIPGVFIPLVLIYAIVATILDGFRRDGRWEGWRLLKQYVKAKRQRVCPIVVFEEPDRGPSP